MSVKRTPLPETGAREVRRFEAALGGDLGALNLLGGEAP